VNYKEFLDQLNSRTGSKPLSLEEQFKARIAKLAKDLEGGSLDELNAKVEQVVESHNRMPRYRFAGLSADEMSSLLYLPLEHGSPVRFKTRIVDDVLDKIGFFRLVEEVLKIIKRDGSIRLTAKLGALPRKILLELYDHHYTAHWPIDEGLFKLRSEDDLPVMGTLHAIVCLSGLVRKVHGKLVLTKLGERMLSRKFRRQLFELVFSTFTMKFNWAYNDRYPAFPVCQNAFAFSIYMVARHGSNEEDKDFYARKFLTAFPDSLEEFEERQWSTAEESMKHCYRLRTFARFLEWFNLVKTTFHEDDAGRTQSLVKKSEIMDEIFVVT
jgi:hypothetical protein